MNKINNSEFINIMNERGFIHQITDMENLQKEMNAGSVYNFNMKLGDKILFVESDLS